MAKKTSRPRGRPKSAAPKTAVVLVRFTPEELKLIDRNIKDLNRIHRISASRPEAIRQWIRNVLGANKPSVRLWDVEPGARFYVGGVVAESTDIMKEADFRGQSWTEVKGWRSMGGTDGSLLHKNRFTIVKGDPGQTACIAAEADDSDYAFRITFKSGAERLYAATVISARKIARNAGALLQVEVALSSNVVKVDREPE